MKSTGEGSKHIVITGVTQGLGRAMAQALVVLGHRVSGCGRNSSSVERLKESLPEVDAGLADVTDERAIAGFASAVLERWGPPDFLLNNAAVINRNAPLWEVSSEEFEEIIQINLGGVHRVLRHFLPPMIARNRGVVVNFSSGWGRSTSPDVAPYCATKYGIEGMTSALAADLAAVAPGVAAVALNPGIIDTAMLRSCFGSGASGFPDPDTWAQSAVPFLLSLGATHNGAALTVPGHH